MHTIVNRDNTSKCMYVAVLLLLMYNHQLHNYVYIVTNFGIAGLSQPDSCPGYDSFQWSLQ